MARIIQIVVVEVLVGDDASLVELLAVLGALAMTQVTVIEIDTARAIQHLASRTLTLAKTPLVHTLLIVQAEDASAIVVARAAVLHIHLLHFDGNVLVGLLLHRRVRKWLVVEAHVHHAAVLVVA